MPLRLFESGQLLLDQAIVLLLRPRAPYVDSTGPPSP